MTDLSTLKLNSLALAPSWNDNAAMTRPGHPPLLTPSEMTLVFRLGATDEEIERKIRDLYFWSYILRNPFAEVCAVGRGTRADCLRHAFRLGDDHAIDCFSVLEDEADEMRALNGSWRLVLWPPKFDIDPTFWAASSDVFDNAKITHKTQRRGRLK
jgi:hypothetical protein